MKKKLEDKIERIEKLILGMKKVDDLFDMWKLSLFSQSHLQSNFKILELNKCNSIGYPSTYMKMYIKSLQPMGINEDVMA